MITYHCLFITFRLSKINQTGFTNPKMKFPFLSIKSFSYLRYTKGLSVQCPIEIAELSWILKAE